MNALKINETDTTPAIRFDYSTGRLEIVGYHSMPEVSMKFYQPVISWVNEYIKKPVSRSTTVVFKLVYFNSSSNKCFVEIFKKLDALAVKGHPVYLKWYYEEDDEDMYRLAEEIETFLDHLQIEKIPFND